MTYEIHERVVICSRGYELVREVFPASDKNGQTDFIKKYLKEGWEASVDGIPVTIDYFGNVVYT